MRVARPQRGEFDDCACVDDGTLCPGCWAYLKARDAWEAMEEGRGDYLRDVEKEEIDRG